MLCPNCIKSADITCPGCGYDLNNAIRQSMATAEKTGQEAARRIVAAAQARLRESSNKPPELYREGFPLRYWDSRWQIGFLIDPRLTSIYSEADGNAYTCPALPQKPFLVRFWLPVSRDGSYSVTALCIEGPEMLPHVSTGGSCLAIGDGPAKLATREDYNRLKTSIRRAIGQANLMSLFTGYREWPLRIRKAFPKELRDFLVGGARRRALDPAVRSLGGLVRSYPQLWTKIGKAEESDTGEHITWHATAS